MSRIHRLILTRRANELYLLTRGKPIIAEIGRSGREDAYIAPGDPFGVNNLCEFSADQLFDVRDLAPLSSVRVWLQGGQIETIPKLL